MKSKIYKKPQAKTHGNSNENQINKKYLIAIPVFIILIILVVYSNLSKNEFLNWDDNLYVTENADITGLKAENVNAFFTKKYVSNYLPLTMLTYAVDYKIGGLSPAIYTATNLLIHIANSLLVYWLIIILLKKTGNGNLSIYIAGLTALFFAIHPLQVESVAWVSERKNVLYAFFFFLSLISYLKYIETGKKKFLIFSVVLFTLSLLSKGVAVSLALCIVIIDYYYGRKLLSIKVILEKIPFLLLALVFGTVAFIAQHEENMLVGNVKYPFYEQLAFASYGFVNYIIKLVFPANISAYYSYPQEASLVYYLCLLVVLVFIASYYYLQKRISPFLNFCILFFIANIIFLVQIIPVGNALMADRYIYVSSVGFFLLLAYGIISLTIKNKATYLLLAGVILLLAFSTHQQVKIWNNSMVFWDNVISKDEYIPRAWNNRGVVKKDKGDNAGALEDFNRAIALMPEFCEAYNNKGIALYNLGRTEEALMEFTKAIKLDSVYTDAICNRGIVRSKTNYLTEALDDFNRTIAINPDYVKAYTGRGEVKIKLNDYDAAIADGEKAIELNSNFAEAYSVKAQAYYNRANYSEAIKQYSYAIRLSPNDMNNYHNRGAAYFYSGNYTSAINDMNLVLQYIPNQGVSYYIRGMSYALTGNNQQACIDLQNSINNGFGAAQADFNKYCH